MPIRITLSDNEVLEVGISLAEWNVAYQRAQRGSTMIEIQEPDGHILSINPSSVIKLESSPDPTDGEPAQAAVAGPTQAQLV